MINSSVFYLVTGAEVATIKSVWHIQICVKKRLLMKPSDLTIIIIKGEKNAIESQS